MRGLHLGFGVDFPVAGCAFLLPLARSVLPGWCRAGGLRRVILEGVDA